MDNILTGYCFLAALTENQNDLFNHVYVPICKRTLSLYSLKYSTHGTAKDIKNLILEEYGIDIPHIMVKKLINATFKSLSSRAKRKINFNVFENGETFEIQKYAFSDLEIHYKKGQRNAIGLQNAFSEYLKAESIDIEDIPSFSDFLGKNKKHLASFFKSTKITNGELIDKTFIHHVHFLEYIEVGNHELFEIAKGLYVGSLVASFLEAGVDLEPKFDSNEIYYLDTPIILRALDLQKEEETEPINELLNLIRSTGGQIKVLSITIDEIFKIIESSIENYNNTTPTTTINEACIRLNKNRAWLMTYNAHLESNIMTTLKAEKEEITNSFIVQNQNSPDIKALQAERLRKSNALHDVLAYLFVREKRGGSATFFQKAKVWFLTNNYNLLEFNRNHNPNHGISEIVLPDALTGLLWLKNPSKLLSKVKSIGLAELMACTMNEEISSKELINEFEATISKIEGIGEDDYRTLLESVAHQSAKKIEHFNEVAFHEPGKAKIEALKIVEWENSRKAKRTKKIKDTQQEKVQIELKYKGLNEKFEKIETELSNTKSAVTDSQTQIEVLSEKIDKQNRITKRIIILTIAILLIAVIFIIGSYFFEALSLIDKIFKWVMSAGGLFAFIGLVFNIVKYFKSK